MRYSVSASLRPVVACHCSDCRHFNGHFAAYTAVDRQALTIHDDKSCLQWYCKPANVRRGFCKLCGSSLFWDRTDREIISISAGSLDEPTELYMCAHIYVASKGDYYALTDDLKQFSEGLPNTGSDPLSS